MEVETCSRLISRKNHAVSRDRLDGLSPCKQGMTLNAAENILLPMNLKNCHELDSGEMPLDRTLQGNRIILRSLNGSIMLYI